jgi:hypothetical protein
MLLLPACQEASIAPASTTAVAFISEFKLFGPSKLSVTRKAWVADWPIDRLRTDAIWPVALVNLLCEGLTPALNALVLPTLLADFRQLTFLLTPLLLLSFYPAGFHILFLFTFTSSPPAIHPSAPACFGWSGQVPGHPLSFPILRYGPRLK